MTNAPAGYEWKYVKLPREKRVTPNKWRECIFVTSGDKDATVAVLVPEGEPGIKRSLPNDWDRC